MRILFAGTPDVAVPALEALHESDHEVVAVLTRADARRGRGRTLHPSPVKERALELGIEVLTDAPHGDEFLAKLAELEVDVAAVVAYGQILRPEILDAVPNGWINLHFSVLPAWRGAAPVQRAIISGDEFSGASTFVIEPELDSGPIIGVMTQRIPKRATAGDLLDSLAQSGAGLLVRTMDAVADSTVSPVEQSPDGVSYAPKLTAQEGCIAWQQPALHIDRLVRGFTPNPGAWTTLPDGARLGIGPVELAQAQPAEVTEPLAPGQVLVTRHAVYVGTGTVPVKLGDVRPPGKRAMVAADWARGARLSPETVLGEQS